MSPGIVLSGTNQRFGARGMLRVLPDSKLQFLNNEFLVREGYVRFAIEELPTDSLNGAYLQVEEARFDQNGIRSLYESEAFPLPRRRKPAASTDADAA